jgi:predicted Zn-dependent peptidase
MNQPNRKRGPSITTITDVPLPSVNNYQLSNGIVVYDVGGALQDVIKLEIVFNCGRPNEPKKMISKAVSYLLKEGTIDKTSLEIAEKVDHYGATLKTTTNLDDSRIILYSLSKFFPKVLPLVVEIITKAQFPLQELTNYVENRIQSLKLDLAKDEFVAYRILTEKIFGEDHPYGYNSSEELFRTLNQDDIRAYHADNYGAANCTIFISGKTTEDTRKILEDQFGSLAQKQKATISIPQVIDQKKDIFIESSNVHQTAIRIGKRLFNRKHQDYASLFFLSTLFGGYFGSRLMSNLREEKGYTYSIYSGLDDFVHDGYFYISADVGNEFVADSIKEIQKELDILMSEPISDEEVSLVKNYLMGNFLNSLDGPFNQAQVVRSFLSKTGDWRNFSDFIESIKTMDASKLSSVATKYLNPDTMITVLVGSKAN